MSEETLGQLAVEQIDRMSGVWGGGKSNTRPEARSSAIKIIDDLAAQQQTCGCEKLREALEDMMREYESKWSDEPPALIQAREALAQPCGCQKTPAKHRDQPE